MINAICGIKTSVCTGNCNSCVNSPLLGKTAVEETEYSKSAYNKGYADGQKEGVLMVLCCWKQIARSYDSGETQKKSFERIDRLAEWQGVKEELEEWTE